VLTKRTNTKRDLANFTPDHRRVQTEKTNRGGLRILQMCSKTESYPVKLYKGVTGQGNTRTGRSKGHARDIPWAGKKRSIESLANLLGDLVARHKGGPDTVRWKISTGLCRNIKLPLSAVGR